MKTQSFPRAAILLLFAVIFSTSLTFAGGSIIGKVIDPETKQPVHGATVMLESEGTKRDYTTNEAGFFYASNIPAGVYTIVASFQGNDAVVPDIKIGNDEVKEIEIPLSMTITLWTVVVDEPINLSPREGEVIDRETIAKLPIQKTIDITGTLAGVVSFNGEYYVRGARAGSTSYYIDGCRVMGTPNIPLCGLDTYRAYTAFVPAKYGDCTGGVIVMETRNFFSEQ